MARQGDTWIVTATYNEAQNLPALTEQILGLPCDAGLVVVDDASPDGTGRLADELAQAAPGRVDVIHRAGKLGYASAHQQGIRRALDLGAQSVITMDADQSHSPGVIPSMIDELSSADVVIGSRYVAGGGTEGWPLSRRVLSRVAGAAFRVASGVRAKDPTGGFRAYTREILERAKFEEISQEGYGFLYELLFRCVRAGAVVTEVPITFTERRAGQSKMSGAIAVEAAWNLLSLFGRRVSGWRP